MVLELLTDKQLSTVERKLIITVYKINTIKSGITTATVSLRIDKVTLSIFLSFFSFIFCNNFCSKSMNVRKNLVISAIPQEKLSNYHKILLSSICKWCVVSVIIPTSTFCRERRIL